jgi:hypothetical protein
MSCRNSKQSERRPFRGPPALFPVSEGMNAYSHRPRESRLSQPDEAPQRGHIFTGLESALHQALADAGGYGAS